MWQWKPEWQDSSVPRGSARICSKKIQPHVFTFLNFSKTISTLENRQKYKETTKTTYILFMERKLLTTLLGAL